MIEICKRHALFDCSTLHATEVPAEAESLAAAGDLVILLTLAIDHQRHSKQALKEVAPPSMTLNGKKEKL